MGDLAVSVLINWVSAIRQTLTVPSLLAEATVWPSGEKASWVTSWSGR
jgi:hypothetical protein